MLLTLWKPFRLFTPGIAAESVALFSVGETFCRNARQLLPAILLIGGGRNFRNLVKLFLMWNQRIESATLLVDKNAIEAQLKRLDNKVIDPLGAEGD